jgi:WD40 repeat protein
LAPRARQYEAFISYSHAADGPLAAQLQRTLNGIARPSYKWWQRWPPRVFRDQTNLAAVGDLTGEIRRALEASDSLVLLASPPAAASRWVDKEAETWLRSKPRERLFLALTEGTLEWDDERSDFDAARTTALPPTLYGAFDAEPLWVDFTAVREDRPFARDPLFLDGAATLAAAVRRADKDALIGEDVRQRRRARQLAGGAIATVTLLAIVATIAAVYAFVQRDRAIDRARLALSRQFAAQAVAALDVDPERSVALAARAATTAPTDEADSALRRAIRTSRLRSIIEAGASVNDVDVAADASLVAAAIGNGDVRIWDASTRSAAGRFHVERAPALGVSFSGDGSRILGASEAEAVVWSTAGDGSAPLARFPASDRILSAALSPDGAVAATGHFGGVLRLWRVDTGELERELRPPGRAAPITAVAFAHDGRRVAAAAGARAAVWAVRGGAAPVAQAHESDVYAVSFSPDGRRLATGDVDGVVRVWRLGTGKAAVLIGHEGKVTSVAFAPDGRSLVSGGVDETARIWDVGTADAIAELRGHSGLVQGVAFDRSGETIATGGTDRAIRLWAAAADPVRAELVSPNLLRVNDVSFDPSGARVVTAGRDRVVRVWELESATPLHELGHGTEPDDWVEAAGFDGTGRIVASAGDDGTVRIWDARTGAPHAMLGRPGGRELYDVALSPDGELVVAGGADEAARVWRWRERELVARLPTPGRRVRSVAFSRDGRHVAVAAGRAVRVWRDGAFGRPFAVFGDPGADEDNEFWSVAFAPGGRRVAAGDWSGWWTVWDVETRKLVARGKANVDIVAGIAFSGNGAYLVTADWKGAAKVWRVPGGGLVTATRTAASSLEAAAFAPHGRLIAVAGTGGRATVFECVECRPLRELVCVAARRVTVAVRARERDAFAHCG